MSLHPHPSTHPTMHTVYFVQLKPCMEWSWYLANDMQFFWFTPPLIFLYCWKPTIGADAHACAHIHTHTHSLARSLAHSRTHALTRTHSLTHVLLAARDTGLATTVVALMAR